MAKNQAPVKTTSGACDVKSTLRVAQGVPTTPVSPVDVIARKHTPNVITNEDE